MLLLVCHHHQTALRQLVLMQLVHQTALHLQLVHQTALHLLLVLLPMQLEYHHQTAHHSLQQLLLALLLALLLPEWPLQLPPQLCRI